MLNPDAFNEYVKRATGAKFLVTPHALPQLHGHSPPDAPKLSLRVARNRVDRTVLDSVADAKILKRATHRAPIGSDPGRENRCEAAITT